MFYRKEPLLPKSKQKIIAIKDFSGDIPGEREGRRLIGELVNLKVQEGKLKSGFGARLLKVRERCVGIAADIFPERLYFYNGFDYGAGKSDLRLLVYASDKRMYELPLDGETYQLSGVPAEFPKPPKSLACSVGGEEGLLFYGQDGLTGYFNNAVKAYEDAPVFCSMCVDKERFFGYEEQKGFLWYSGSFSPDFSGKEAGFIAVDGGKGALIGFKGDIYLIKEQRILKIVHDGTTGGIEVKRTNFNAGRIYPESALAIGDELVFLTNGGLYSFDGSRFDCLAEEAFAVLKGRRFELKDACVFDKSLFFTVQVNDGEQFIIRYNYTDKTYCTVKGAAVKHFCAAADSMYIIRDADSKIGEFAEDGVFFGKALCGVFKSKETDFGITGNKVLKEVCLESREDIFLTVRSEAGCRRTLIKGSKDVKCVPVKLKGDKFSLETESGGNAEISNPLLIFNIKEGSRWLR